MRRAAGLLLTLTLGACSGTTVGSSPTTSTVAPGPIAFLQWAHTTATLGGHRLGDTVDDDTLLKLGNNTCAQMTDGKSFGDVVTSDNKAGLTLAEGQALVREAVTNLCPQYRDRLP